VFRHCNILKTIFATLALGGVALLVGCGGLNQKPLAPDRTATLQKADESTYSSDDSPFTLVLAPKGFDPSKARVRAAKPTAVKVAAGLFSPKRNGSLEVNFGRRSGSDGVGVQKATFEVAKGSLDREVLITMTAFSGSTLGDVGCKFTPAGLKFKQEQPGILKFVLVGNLDKEDFKGLKVYHIEGNTVTELSVQVQRSGKNEWIIIIKVPGFSIYSIGDDLIPEAGP